MCDPQTKAEQVAGRIEELANDMAHRLRPYFHTGDLAAELMRAKKDARSVARALMACGQAQMFGPLLRQMQVTPDLISSVYWELQSSPDDAPAPIGTIGSRDDYLSALGGLLDDEPAAPAVQARDRFERVRADVCPPEPRPRRSVRLEADPLDTRPVTRTGNLHEQPTCGAQEATHTAE